jgi:hypothetical protein
MAAQRLHLSLSAPKKKPSALQIFSFSFLFFLPGKGKVYLTPPVIGVGGGFLVVFLFISQSERLIWFGRNVCVLVAWCCQDTRNQQHQKITRGESVSHKDIKKKKRKKNSSSLFGSPEKFKIPVKLSLLLDRPGGEGWVVEFCPFD